jgi:hypothetical protein
MASIVKIKRSAVAGKIPTVGNLESGELALNLADGRLYSTDGSAVFEIGANVHSLSVGAGGLTIANGAFTFPTSDGTEGQVLTTNGSGTVSWADQSGSGSGLDSLGYTNSTKTGDTLFADDSVDLGTLSGGDTTDAFGVLINGEILDCMEPIRETRTHDFAVLS